MIEFTRILAISPKSMIIFICFAMKPRNISYFNAAVGKMDWNGSSDLI
jgi:hypothetical protein